MLLLYISTACVVSIMSKYYPHLLPIVRKDNVRRGDIIKGTLLIASLSAFIVGLFVASNYGQESYRYSALACTLQDKENCPALLLLE